MATTQNNVSPVTWPKRAVVTAGMPYGNKPLHFGHVAGVFVPADCFARFLRDRIGAELGIARRGSPVPRSLLLCHFLPYLYIWLPLHALDERDGLDVVGVREHVHGLHRSHAVAELL